ncbi:MAG: chemotaxis protein CheX [Eubacteriales bacterium]|nr:chemotaxis protein CheX [Eubacteriales bacterium]
MKDKMFNSYIAKQHIGSTFTDRELKAIQTGDVDSIVKEFCNMKNERYVLQLQSMIKCMSSCMGDNVELHNISLLNEYKGRFIGCQVMDGDADIFLGIAGEDDAMLKVASQFAMEELGQFDVDAYDALCELINVMNGAYATRLGEDNIVVNLHPPVFYTDTMIAVDKGLYVVTFAMGDKEFQMLMAVDEKVKMTA